MLVVQTHACPLFLSSPGAPLANVQVQVKTLPSADADRDKAKTVSNAFGNRSHSKRDGTVLCKVGISTIGWGIGVGHCHGWPS